MYNHINEIIKNMYGELTLNSFPKATVLQKEEYSLQTMGLGFNIYYSYKSLFNIPGILGKEHGVTYANSSTPLWINRWI